MNGKKILNLEAPTDGSVAPTPPKITIKSNAVPPATATTSSPPPAQETAPPPPPAANPKRTLSERQQQNLQAGRQKRTDNIQKLHVDRVQKLIASNPSLQTALGMNAKTTAPDTANKNEETPAPKDSSDPNTKTTTGSERVGDGADNNDGTQGLKRTRHVSKEKTKPQKQSSSKKQQQHHVPQEEEEEDDEMETGDEDGSSVSETESEEEESSEEEDQRQVTKHQQKKGKTQHKVEHQSGKHFQRPKAPPQQMRAPAIMYPSRGALRFI
jgi:hypothetical protein